MTEAVTGPRCVGTGKSVRGMRRERISRAKTRTIGSTAQVQMSFRALDCAATPTREGTLHPASALLSHFQYYSNDAYAFRLITSLISAPTIICVNARARRASGATWSGGYEFYLLTPH